MPGVFGIGVSGIKVAQQALDTIANNIANANTPGYSRQEVTTTSSAGVRSGAGFNGTGVSVGGIVSIINPFLEQQVTRTKAQYSEQNILSNLINQIESRVSGSGGQLLGNLSDLSKALGQASSDPTSVVSRNLVINQINGVVEQYKNVGGYLDQLKSDVSQQTDTAIKSANILIKQIADLNNSISTVEPKDQNGLVLEGNLANDLRDKRQYAINQLSELIGVSTTESPEGINVYTGGVAVIIGGQSSILTTSIDPLDPNQRNIQVQSKIGTTILKPDQLGSKIGGLSKFLNEDLNQAKVKLDQSAYSFATAINNQNALGLNLNGQLGNSLLQIGGQLIQPSANNTGSATLNVVVDPTNIPSSDYKISFSASNGYELTRLSDGVFLGASSSGSFNIDGLQINVASGTAAPGDQFKITPFQNASNTLTLLTKDPKALAFANPLTVDKALQSSSGLSIDSISLKSAAGNLEDVSITFTGSNQVSITSASLGTVVQSYQSNVPISINGWELKLTGTPAVGDSLMIKKNISGLGNSDNLNEIVNGLSKKNFLSGTASINDIVSNLQSEIGIKSQLYSNQASASLTLRDLATKERESFSGVNLDEEAANLAKWQQIYAANARVLSIAQDLFNQLVKSF